MLKTERFYDKDCFMWVMFGTISPVGIILMWKNKRYRIIPRIITSILYLFYFLIISGTIGSENSGLSFTAEFIRLSIFFVIIPYIVVHCNELYQKVLHILENKTNRINKEVSYINKNNINTKPKFLTKICEYIEKQKLKKEARENHLKQLESERQQVFSLYRQGKSLPMMNCSMILHKGEICHLICNAKRLEIKNKTVGYTGGYRGSSFHIAKGITLHAGGSRSHAIKRDVRFEYPGNLYITNKRIVFIGSNKNFTINLSKLLEYKLYKDGVAFNTDRISYVVKVADVECMGAILQGTINNFIRN